MDNPTSPQKTYTALALNDSSELPPSPICTVMTSSVGIDPKWEFPRENILLLEVLSDGQFTILRKGIAKGFSDNKSCEVAVKSLRGMCVCGESIFSIIFDYVKLQAFMEYSFKN